MQLIIGLGLAATVIGGLLFAWRRMPEVRIADLNTDADRERRVRRYGECMDAELAILERMGWAAGRR